MKHKLAMHNTCVKIVERHSSTDRSLHLWISAGVESGGTSPYLSNAISNILESLLLSAYSAQAISGQNEHPIVLEPIMTDQLTRQRHS